MPASSAKKLSYAAVVSSPPPTDGPVSSTPAAPRASDDLVAGQDHLVAIPAPPKAAKSTKKAATGKSSKKAPVRPSPPSTKKKVVSPVVVVGQAVKSDPKNAVGAPSDPAVSSSKRANGHIVPVLGKDSAPAGPVVSTAVDTVAVVRGGRTPTDPVKTHRSSSVKGPSTAVAIPDVAIPEHELSLSKPPRISRRPAARPVETVAQSDDVLSEPDAGALMDPDDPTYNGSVGKSRVESHPTSDVQTRSRTRGRNVPTSGRSSASRSTRPKATAVEPPAQSQAKQPGATSFPLKNAKRSRSAGSVVGTDSDSGSLPIARPRPKRVRLLITDENESQTSSVADDDVIMSGPGEGGDGLPDPEPPTEAASGSDHLSDASTAHVGTSGQNRRNGAGCGDEEHGDESEEREDGEDGEQSEEGEENGDSEGEGEGGEDGDDDEKVVNDDEDEEVDDEEDDDDVEDDEDGEDDGVDVEEEGSDDDGNNDVDDIDEEHDSFIDDAAIESEQSDGVDDSELGANDDNAMDATPPPDAHVDEAGSPSASSASLEPPPSTQPPRQRKKTISRGQSSRSVTQIDHSQGPTPSLQPLPSTPVRGSTFKSSLTSKNPASREGRGKSTSASGSRLGGGTEPVDPTPNPFVDAGAAPAFAPLTGRKTFGSVIPAGPADQQVYLEDLEFISFTNVPDICGVTHPDLQDPQLKHTYVGRPNLPAGVFTPWNDEKGTMMMFSVWTRVCQGMDYENVLNAILFVRWTKYINISMVSPVEVLIKRIPGATLTKHLYTAQRKPAVCISLACCKESYLYSYPDTGYQHKRIDALFHSQEWERIVGFVCMVFGTSPLAAQLSKGRMQISTKSFATKDKASGASPSKVVSGMYSEHQSPAIGSTPSSYKAPRRDPFTLSPTDDIPVYDARRVVYNMQTDLDKLHLLPKWTGGEIPVDSCVAVAYTLSSFKGKRGESISFNLQWIVVYGTP